MFSIFLDYIYSVIQTQCLGGLLTYFSSNGNTVAASFDQMPTIQRRIFQYGLNMGYLHAAGIVLCSLFSIVINNEFNMYAARLGMQIRAICGSLLYREVSIKMFHYYCYYYSAPFRCLNCISLNCICTLLIMLKNIDAENVQINHI